MIIFYLHLHLIILPIKIKGKRFNLCSQVHPLPQAFGNEAGAPPGGPCKVQQSCSNFEAGLPLIVWHLVGVLEVVGGHDSLEAVVVTKHEGYSHLVYAIRYLAQNFITQVSKKHAGLIL